MAMIHASDGFYLIVRNFYVESHHQLQT